SSGFGDYAPASYSIWQLSAPPHRHTMFVYKEVTVFLVPVPVPVPSRNETLQHRFPEQDLRLKFRADGGGGGGGGGGAEHDLGTPDEPLRKTRCFLELGRHKG
ncbi:hypothetical protein E4U43_005184, partial [Claviceps pusilla]